MRRWLLRGVVALLLLAIAALPLALRVRAVEDMVRAQIVGFLSKRLTGTVTAGRVSGVLPRSLVVENLQIDVDGRPVVELPELRLVLAPWALLLGRVQLQEVTLRGLRVRAVDELRGWRVPTARPVDPLTIIVELRHLVVSDARIEVAVPVGAVTHHIALDDVSLVAHARLSPGGHTVTVEALRVHPRGIALGDLQLTGRANVTPGNAIHVELATLTSARSRITVTGHVDLRRDADVRVELAPLSRRDVQALIPAHPFRTDVAATLTARGPWGALAVTSSTNLGPAGRVDAAGTLDLAHRTPRYRATATFADVDPGAALDGLVRAQATGRARVHGQGRAFAYGVAVADSTVADIAVARARLTARSVRGVHRGHVDLDTAGAQASGRVRVVTRGEPAYRAGGRIAARDLAALSPGLVGHAAARLALRGQGLVPAQCHASLDATLLDADLAGVRLDGGMLHATVDRERLVVETFRLSGAGLHAEARGALDGDRHTLDATVDATGDLALLTAARATPIAGAATLHAVAAGRPEAPTLALELSGTDLRTARGSVAELRGDARGALLGAAAGGTLTLAAHGITTPSGEVHEATTALAWRPAPGGVGATVTQLSIVPAESPAWQLAKPASLTVGNDVRVGDLVLQSGAQRVTLDGHAAAAGPAEATLGLTAVDLGPLCARATAEACDGTLSGEARLSGTADAPRWIVDARVDRLAGAGIPIGTLETHCTYATRSAVVRATLGAAGGGHLQVEGTLPVDLAWDGAHPDLTRAPISGTLRTEALPLGFIGALAPKHIRDPRGALTADLRLTGTRTAPRLEGTAVLTDGRVTLTATGVTYQDVAATIRAGGDGLDLTDLRARTGDGTLSADGRLALDGLRPGALAVTIRLHEFTALRLPAIEATVASALRLEGTLGAPLLRGSVLVTHAVVRPSLIPSSGVRQVRDPTIEVVGLPETPAPPAAPFPLADALGLELRIKIGEDAWIRRIDADIALGGEVRVQRHPPEAMQLDGRIRLVRGWYNFQGRRFQIEGGGATFTTPNHTDPVLDVRATYRAPEYLITVQVGGTLAAPALTLSSDPPLDQADVLAVILFGKPVNALARGESVALERQTASLGGGFVMPELRGSVMSSLGLSTLDVEMPAQGQAGNTANPGVVRVGRYVSSDLFVSLAQEFGTRAGQVFGVEYALTPKLALKLSTSTRGSSAIDAFWHRRY